MTMQYLLHLVSTRQSFHEVEWLNFIEKEELVEVLRILWKCRNNIWHAGQNVDHMRIQIMLDDLVVGKRCIQLIAYNLTKKLSSNNK